VADSASGADKAGGGRGSGRGAAAGRGGRGLRGGRRGRGAGPRDPDPVLAAAVVRHLLLSGVGVDLVPLDDVDDADGAGGAGGAGVAGGSGGVSRPPRAPAGGRRWLPIQGLGPAAAARADAMVAQARAAPWYVARERLARRMLPSVEGDDGSSDAPAPPLAPSALLDRHLERVGALLCLCVSIVDASGGSIPAGDFWELLGGLGVPRPRGDVSAAPGGDDDGGGGGAADCRGGGGGLADPPPWRDWGPDPGGALLRTLRGRALVTVERGASTSAAATGMGGGAGATGAAGAAGPAGAAADDLLTLGPGATVLLGRPGAPTAAGEGLATWVDGLLGGGG